MLLQRILIPGHQMLMICPSHLIQTHVLVTVVKFRDKIDLVRSGKSLPDFRGYLCASGWHGRCQNKWHLLRMETCWIKI